MLRPGARVAVISPSGISNPERLWRGIAELEAWGFRPELLPHARREHRYLAGTDAERASDLFRAFSGDYDAVWMARGGYGLSRLVGNVNWEELAPVPLPTSQESITRSGVRAPPRKRHSPNCVSGRAPR